MANTNQLFFIKTPKHATYSFGQDSKSLYLNQPRLPFEYYINVQLNKSAGARKYISNFFDDDQWKQVQPLVKTVDMPSMKIETESLNQYNRKRLVQSRVNFDPVKMVFHDVVDGKTLKFWDMYYRYYFADGNESGKNMSPTGMTKSNNPSGSIDSVYANPLGLTPSPYDSIGEKRATQNIISDALHNHNFGVNLSQIKNDRNLIEYIEIFQVHGGKFNRVTLVNPRVIAFNHATLDYGASDRTLELTFTFEYEYAYYTIDNMRLGGSEINNESDISRFVRGAAGDSDAIKAAFSVSLADNVTSPNRQSITGNPSAMMDGSETNRQLITGGGNSSTGVFAQDGGWTYTQNNPYEIANGQPINPYEIANGQPVSSSTSTGVFAQDGGWTYTPGNPITDLTSGANAAKAGIFSAGSSITTALSTSSLASMINVAPISFIANKEALPVLRNFESIATSRINEYTDVNRIANTAASRALGKITYKL